MHGIIDPFIKVPQRHCRNSYIEGGRNERMGQGSNGWRDELKRQRVVGDKHADLQFRQGYEFIQRPPTQQHLKVHACYMKGS